MSEPTPSMSRDEAEEQLREWAEEHGWQIVFPNDALDADVRPGVVDAVLSALDAEFGPENVIMALEDVLAMDHLARVKATEIARRREGT